MGLEQSILILTTLRKLMIS